MKNKENRMLISTLKRLSISPKFANVKYNSKMHPKNKKWNSLDDGANCQKYVYEILKVKYPYEFIKDIDYRSSELWNGSREFWTVNEYEPLEPFDIVLFNKTRDAYGAHVGLFVDEMNGLSPHMINGGVLHLSKENGLPEVTTWQMMKMKYKYYIGAKRLSLY